MRLQRTFRPVLGIAGLLAVVVALGGCSTDDPVPFCENCEIWTPVSAGLGRFPELHPSDPTFLVYSTIEKTPNTPDANREADEDIWLLYRGESLEENVTWQLTDDALGFGDNTAARWSPSGTQIAFVHSTPGGRFEIWRMPVTLPAVPTDAPITGIAERLVRDARDPAWASETEIYFTRDDKLFRVDVPPGSGPPSSQPLQLTFDPPTFASTEQFVDRNPMFALDGGGIFSTIGRRNVADIYLRAFEIDDTVFPPDTTETAAWISYRSPQAQGPTYPIFAEGDTLRTPRVLRSVPVGEGGRFTLGTRRDSRFLDPLTEAYCDTLITVGVDLQPGDVDSISYYFRVVRSTLTIRSGIGRADIFWARQDGRETIFNFTNAVTVASPGGSLAFECLMPFAVQAGQINPARQETLLVSATRGPLADSARIVLTPGTETIVDVFRTGTISGTIALEDNPPPPLPLGLVEAFVAGTSVKISQTFFDTATGDFTMPAVPAGVFDVTVSIPGSTYVATTLTDIPVTPPGDTPVGTVTLLLTPAAGPVPYHAVAIDGAPAAPPVRRVLRRNPDSSMARGTSGSLASVFRAEGDLTTVWRLSPDPTGLPRIVIDELFGSEFQIQNPAVTEDLGGGVRYVAYSSDETGDWQLFVQRLESWVAKDPPVRIVPPGSSDNLSCIRNVFHPRWIRGGTPGKLELIVTLGDCPGNGFEDLGIDDNPWAVGEIRLWRVTVPSGI